MLSVFKCDMFLVDGFKSCLVFIGMGGAGLVGVIMLPDEVLEELIGRVLLEFEVCIEFEV